MEYLQRGLMSHGLDPGGVKPLDASIPRASGEVAGLGPSRNPSSSSMGALMSLCGAKHVISASSASCLASPMAMRSPPSPP